MMQRASFLEVFRVSSNALIGEEFALKMSRIGYPVHIHSLQSELVFNAALCPSSACFAKDYDRNLKKKIEVSGRVEKDHYASSSILKEDE